MWISNPLVNPLFAGTLLAVGSSLSGGLALILASLRAQGRRLAGSLLFERWRVWAILAPLYTLALLAGPLPTLLLFAALIAQGLREYAALVGLPRSYRRVLLGCGLLAAPVAALSPAAFGALPPVLLVAATLQPLIWRSGESVRHLVFAVFGWGYIAWFLAHGVLLYRLVPGGPGILLAIGVCTALSDVGAFVVGKALGRHKLAPELSPNKTWEGVGGNLLGAYLGGALSAFALPAGPLVWVLPALVALGALWGDLLESSLKREFGVKDAGSWLPGFGGLLDRFDSLILVLPLVYYFLQLVG
jgi:phosphatidate cytidylyltransferase